MLSGSSSSCSSTNSSSLIATGVLVVHIGQVVILATVVTVAVLVVV